MRPSLGETVTCNTCDDAVTRLLFNTCQVPRGAVWWQGGGRHSVLPWALPRAHPARPACLSAGSWRPNLLYLGDGRAAGGGLGRAMRLTTHDSGAAKLFWAA